MVRATDVVHVRKPENLAANPDVEFCSKWNRFLRGAGGVPLREGIGIAIATTRNTAA
jgi:hypothetical protein